MPKRTNQSGFTVVELLISIAIFSVVLLICAAAIIYIGRVYHKGNIITRTQETSRAVIEDVAQAIQFGPRDAHLQTGADGTNLAYCIGNTRYTYNTGAALGNGASHVLWRDNLGGAGGTCVPANFTEPTGVELLGDNMRLPRFVVVESSGAWSIDLRVAYGDELDLFIDDDPNKGCISIDIGGQFCSVSNSTTTIVKRL